MAANGNNCLCIVNKNKKVQSFCSAIILAKSLSVCACDEKCFQINFAKFYKLFAQTLSRQNNFANFWQSKKAIVINF